MAKKWKQWGGAVLCVAMVPVVWAQSSPVGLWKTIDERTQTAKAYVRIVDNGGMLVGRVEKILSSDTAPDAVCDLCSDDRKGKPMVGLDIIRDVHRADAETWDGGTILDAKEGKIYKVSLKPVEGGRKLDVHGYIGFALIGRTQTWVRVE